MNPATRTRVCTKCDRILPAEDFSQRQWARINPKCSTCVPPPTKTRRDAYVGYCRSCDRRKSREDFGKNGDRFPYCYDWWGGAGVVKWGREWENRRGFCKTCNAARSPSYSARVANDKRE